MPKVTLIDYTGKGREDEAWHAAHMLIFTKSTRLQMRPGLLDEIKELSEEDVCAELDYMTKTIPSSWEFADVVFLIEGVTRATAQQITRTRQASYAMQTQRVDPMVGVQITNPMQKGTPKARLFQHWAEDAAMNYENALEHGFEPQEARGLLPMNTQCNLVCKYNLRAFADLILSRSSLRAQGEYSDIADAMRAELEAVWPWVDRFFLSRHAHAVAILEEVVKQMDLTVGKGAAWDIAKAIDLIKKG